MGSKAHPYKWGGCQEVLFYVFSAVAAGFWKNRDVLAGCAGTCSQAQNGSTTRKVEDRSRHKRCFYCFFLSSRKLICISLGFHYLWLTSKIGGFSEIKIKTTVFLLHFARIALSLQAETTNGNMRRLFIFTILATFVFKKRHFHIIPIIRLSRR